MKPYGDQRNVQTIINCKIRAKNFKLNNKEASVRHTSICHIRLTVFKDIIGAQWEPEGRRIDVHLKCMAFGLQQQLNFAVFLVKLRLKFI